jgi:hypothetical protein
MSLMDTGVVPHQSHTQNPKDMALWRIKVEDTQDRKISILGDSLGAASTHHSLQSTLCRKMYFRQKQTLSLQLDGGPISLDDSIGSILCEEIISHMSFSQPICFKDHLGTPYNTYIHTSRVRVSTSILLGPFLVAERTKERTHMATKRVHSTRLDQTQLLTHDMLGGPPQVVRKKKWESLSVNHHSIVCTTIVGRFSPDG